jgi:hypothetical protein
MVLQWRNTGYFEALPRLRLTTAPSMGVGIGWLQAWFHVWLWKRSNNSRCRMIELLPRIWLCWSRHGCYLHLEWLTLQWVKRIAVGKGDAP